MLKDCWDEVVTTWTQPKTADTNWSPALPTTINVLCHPSVTAVQTQLDQAGHSLRMNVSGDLCCQYLVKLQSSIAANLLRSSRQRMEQKQGGAPCQATAAAIWLPTSSRRMAGQRQDSTHLGAPGAALASTGAAAFHITAPARFKVVDEHSHTAEFQSLRCQSLTMNAKITPNT